MEAIEAPRDEKPGRSVQATAVAPQRTAGHDPLLILAGIGGSISAGFGLLGVLGVLLSGARLAFAPWLLMFFFSGLRVDLVRVLAALALLLAAGAASCLVACQRRRGYWPDPPLAVMVAAKLTTTGAILGGLPWLAIGLVAIYDWIYLAP